MRAKAGPTRLCVLLALLSPAAGLADASAHPQAWQRVGRDELCVTAGTMGRAGQRLTIDEPTVRANVRDARYRAAELRFTYFGPAKHERALASGLLRRQIGLKLRAHDTCNVVYAMWHIAPDSRIAVSVKRNPGKHRHAECGVQGYVTISPETATTAPAVSPGSRHVLRAELNEDTIAVDADGVRVFSARIDRANLDFDGPVGLRTDNGRFTFEFLVPDRDRNQPAVSYENRNERCHE
jgi:hypothetical protein